MCISINLYIKTFICNVNYSTVNFNKALKTVWWQLSPILIWYRGSPFTHMGYLWLGRNTYVQIMFIFGMKLLIYAITPTVDSFMQDLITPPCPRVYGVLTHWGRDKMTAVFQTTFSTAFSWMKMDEFRLGFHWSLFLRFDLTIFQHWLR